MATIVGGTRQRLIHDSIYTMVEEKLTALGWFTNDLITMVPEELDNNQEITVNTLSLADTDVREDELELGSTAVQTETIMYFDFYAANDAIGKDLIHDIRDILAGRMSSIGRDHPRIPVYDYRMATPDVVFHVDVEDIMVDRARDFPKPWLKHWYTCRFKVVDAYGDEAS